VKQKFQEAPIAGRRVAVWQDCLPKRSEADFEEWRYQEAWAPRTIFAMLPIAAVVTIWNLLGR